MRWFSWFATGGLLALLLLIGLYQLPPVKYRLEWRFDRAEGVIRGWLRPGETLPTPHGAAEIASVPTVAPRTATPTPDQPAEGASATPAPSPTPLPDQVQLPAPEWEKQDWNNCGPATLALGLRFFGWEGDQFDISDLLKPDRGDKNVNIEELVYYVRTRTGWLSTDYRLGGDMETLRRFIAAGIPVIVEKGFVLDETDGGGGWAGHYLLLTGYDEAEQVFIAQDTNPTTGGSNRRVGYQELDEGWQAFNRVFMYIYLPEQEEQVEELLGPDADPDTNRERAMEQARAEIEEDPEDAYAWFNLGTNLIYFERYGEAADAYDQALALGLPWRFTRYQFGPYIAYFNVGRHQDIIELADATLFRTSKAEESRLWRGWARYQLGDIVGAEEDFLGALAVNPNYMDAQYALDFIRSNE
ncbi:MAG: C39 family peptidase [Anaerolineales bacterium]